MKICFMHIRRSGDEVNKGGATVAMEVNDKNLVTAYATSWCHPHDNFCRRTGRVKAEGRLKSARYRVDASQIPLTREEVYEAVAIQVVP